MELDRLYSVSDLHIGGARGHRAFREQRALSWFIGERATRNGARVGLLINGDIFDFLADPANAHEFAPDASARIREYADDGDLRPIFDALRRFVAQPHCFLILQIGNHDVELALPSVQRTLRDIIDPGGAGATRITFESDRHGWACRVGGRMVLAVHGNESDPWNAVDHDGLAAAVSSALTGAPITAPVTNAGTLLVLKVMNAVKKDHPFVDLFKPEGPPLLALLDWVDPQVSRWGMVAVASRLLRRGRLAGARELLGAGNEEVAIPASGPGRDLVDVMNALPAPPPDSAGLMDRAEQNLREGKTPRELAGADAGYLRAGLDAVASKLPRLRPSALWRPPATVLQRALQGWLARDRSFELDQLSDLDRRIIESGRLGFDVLIAGHTHLARARSDTRLTYLNTGTWMRLMKLHDTLFLGDRFVELLTAIEAKSLDAIDALGVDPRLRPVAVVDATSARLESVVESPNGFDLQPLSVRRP